MEEDPPIVALVPSTQHIIFTSAQRNSLPIVLNSFSNAINEGTQDNETEIKFRSSDASKESMPRYTLEALSTVVSILYCYLLVVLGLALPVIRMITTRIPQEFYHMFYIYLYGGSLSFMISLYILSIKKKAARTLAKITKRYNGDDLPEDKIKSPYSKTHGSFYLRLGASFFGIGSMVYSGLEFGEHFLQAGRCESSMLSATKPALRIFFTLLQIKFIFLQENDLHERQCQGLLRISLAHMLATNLAEWLAVVIEETKHEIHHLQPHRHEDFRNQTNLTCDESTPGILLQNATGYLFPCSIEYSLICAVTLVEMWKDIRINKKVAKEPIHLKDISMKKEASQQYSVDCSHSEIGLSAGLVAIVYTLISLIVFFSLRSTQSDAAYLCLTTCESVLYTSSLLAMAIAAYQMKDLAYCVHRFDVKGSLKLGLDISLLLKAQVGAYMYSLFSIIACWYTHDASVWPDLYAILQSSIQTIFILDTWWKRCATPTDQEEKPGRQCLTYLRLMNMALWIITITEKSRAELNPVQLAFYGMWPWTIITHVSMPLNVFYRFHSSICFFEIWRNSYKGIHVKPDDGVMF